MSRVGKNAVSVRGLMPTRFPHRGNWYQSEHERDLIVLLETDFQLSNLETQPKPQAAFTVSGRPRLYTPDVVATWIEGSDYPLRAQNVVFEVKNYRKLRADFDELAPKLKAARLYYKQLGYRFVVITDREIRKQPRLANARILVEHVSHLVSSAGYIAIEAALGGQLQGLRIGDLYDLAATAGVPSQALEPDISRLILGGYILFDGSQSLADDTTLLYWWTDRLIED